jgi:hypothetical protein
MAGCPQLCLFPPPQPCPGMTSSGAFPPPDFEGPLVPRNEAGAACSAGAAAIFGVTDDGGGGGGSFCCWYC